MSEIFTAGSAFMIIDMVNDFILPGAPLEVPDARKILSTLKEKIEEARKKDLFIIYICDSHYPKDSEFSLWPQHAIWGTEGASIVAELKPLEGDYIIPKRKYSGFFATGLDLLLRELGVKRVILTGIVTDICVLHTAADAYMLGYEIVILKDCVAALSKEDQQFALERMERLYNAQIL